MNNKYFKWLKEKVDFLDFPDTYNQLFAVLYNTEFIWKHPMDKNRATDAINLRLEYHLETGLNAPGKHMPANVLEVLISLAKRMNFISSSFDEDRTKIIFWRLLSNLDLSRMDDPNYLNIGGDDRVDIILTRWMNRLYESDGRGGLFPMQKPRQNQREIEIWYQMNQYLSDPNGEDLKSY